MPLSKTRMTRPTRGPADAVDDGEEKAGPADAAAVALSEDLQRELEEIEQEELRG